MAIQVIEALRQELPVTFARSDAPKLIGHIYCYQTLANLDHKKMGPPSSKLGKRTIYERESFLAWLEARMRPNKGGEAA